MDGRTKYARIVKLINSISEKVIHINKLRQMIRMEIGSDEKGVLHTLHLMTDHGFIKEIEPFKYSINKDGM